MNARSATTDRSPKEKGRETSAGNGGTSNCVSPGAGARRRAAVCRRRKVDAAQRRKKAASRILAGRNKRRFTCRHPSRNEPLQSAKKKRGARTRAPLGERTTLSKFDLRLAVHVVDVVRRLATRHGGVGGAGGVLLAHRLVARRAAIAGRRADGPEVDLGIGVHVADGLTGEHRGAVSEVREADVVAAARRCLVAAKGGGLGGGAPLELVDLDRIEAGVRGRGNDDRPGAQFRVGRRRGGGGVEEAVVPLRREADQGDAGVVPVLLLEEGLLRGEQSLQVR